MCSSILYLSAHSAAAGTRRRGASQHSSRDALRHTRVYLLLTACVHVGHNAAGWCFVIGSNLPTVSQSAVLSYFGCC
jgi:hypothetical protein